MCPDSLVVLLLRLPDPEELQSRGLTDVPPMDTMYLVQVNSIVSILYIRARAAARFSVRLRTAVEILIDWF